jgi:hypothetical protein
MSQILLVCLVAAIALGSCGGSSVKSAADDVVDGTPFVIKETTETGDTGVAVAETENGAKIELKMVKDGGEFVLDACQTLEDTQYSCQDVTD